jgi:hypothetical protein
MRPVVLFRGVHDLNVLPLAWKDEPTPTDLR